MTQVGFVGLGSMGASMARRILSHEGNVVMYDPNPDALHAIAAEGATPCASPAEVAARAEVVGASLPSPAVLAEVVAGSGGLLEGDAMAALIDFSTTGPVVARAVAAQLAARGKGFIDAPVSGGPAGAAAGTLTLMVAGEEALLARYRSILETVGTTIQVVGAVPGLGRLAKVINNLLRAASIAVVGEALALGVKGGLDVVTLLDVINASSGRSDTTETLFPRQVVSRAFAHGFRLRLEAKDVALCLDEANRQKTPMLVSAAVGQFWSIADALGGDDDDFTRAAELIERWAGVTLAPGTTA